MEYVPPEMHMTAKLHGVTPQNTIIFLVTTAKIPSHGKFLYQLKEIIWNISDDSYTGHDKKF